MHNKWIKLYKIKYFWVFPNVWGHNKLLFHQNTEVDRFLLDVTKGKYHFIIFGQVEQGPEGEILTLKKKKLSSGSPNENFQSYNCNSQVKQLSLKS